MAKEDTILINKMYVGDYLGENIGHEVINLLKADNGENYIYVLEDGTIAAKWDNKIKTILLARQAEKNTWEILAKAEVVEQLVKQSIKKGNKDEKIKELHEDNCKYLNNLKVTYGKKKLSEIFGNNIGNERAIYATFKVKNVERPERPLYIKFDSNIDENKFEQNKNLITIKKGYPRRSQVIYLKNLQNNNLFNDVEEYLNKIKWNTEKATMTVDNFYKNESDKIGEDILKANFIDIIDKKNAELTYSRLFKHILDSDKELFKKFVNEILDIQFKTDIERDIQREENNIDLLIRIEEKKNNEPKKKEENLQKWIVVIENKIKSGINGKKYDPDGNEVSNQLEKYYKYVNDIGVKKDKRKFNEYKEKRFFIFAPNYNHIDSVSEKIGNYQIIRYKELYEFFNKNRPVKPVKYYNEFLYALSKHTNDTDNVLEVEMFRRFKQRIESL